MAQAYIKVFYDFLDKTKRLDDAEVGRLVRAMLIYARDDVEVDLVGREDTIFPVFQSQIDSDKAAYDTVSAKRRAAGSRGGKAKVANASNCKQDINNNNDLSNNINTSSEKVVVVRNPIDTTQEEDSTYKGLGLPDDVVAIAKERATQYGHDNDRGYILAILRDWMRQGVKTVEDAIRVIEEHDSKKPVAASVSKNSGALNYQQHQYTEADFGAGFYYDPTRDFLR